MGAVSLALLLAMAPIELPEQTVRVTEHTPLYSTAASGVRTTREFVADLELIPGERRVGMELSFLTSPEGLNGRPQRFTDLVASRFDARASLGQRLELGGWVEFLPKQPFPGGQPVFRGGALVSHLQLARRGSLYLGATGAPLVGATGAALELGAGWLARRFFDPERRYLAFAGALGGQWTDLVGHAGGPRIAEVVADGALQFLMPGNEVGFGLEVGTVLAVPAWHRGRAFWLAGSPPFDARTRSHFYLAGYLTVGPRWDLFVRWSILDRGDAAAPATRLPLLRGGYDQTELTFGLSYRFGPNVDG